MQKIHIRRFRVLNIVSVFFLLGMMNLPSWSFAEVAPWNFTVIADWHAAEGFIQEKWRDNQIREKTEQIRLIYEDAGGEFAVLPGDTQGGHWERKSFIDSYAPGATPAEAITKAGILCYSGVVKVFRQAGYRRILYAVGDHEVGDNPWRPNSDKSKNLHVFKKVFADIINRSTDGGKFHFTQSINGVESRPMGTPYEDTSFAYRHKNVLIVTVDVFHQEKVDKVLSEEGTVIGGIYGKHLEWFERILSAARQDESIKHIFVQSHLPILHPVRKMNSSGMYVDQHEHSLFWEAMRKYEVDVYFAGEVHDNTVTKDPQEGSNLVQVVSRGNGGRGFVDVTVHEDRIELVYRVTDKHGKNGPDGPDFITSGRLTIDKSDKETTINSSGVLELINPERIGMHYAFEPVDIMTVEESPFMSIPYSKLPVHKNAVILENRGHWGIGSSAFTVDPKFSNGVSESALVMDQTTHCYAYGMGPSKANDPRTIEAWIKTKGTDPMHVVTTVKRFGGGSNHFDLVLEEGRLVFLNDNRDRLTATGPVINDGKWHQVACVVPNGGKLIRDVRLYIDGKRQPTNSSNPDAVINTPANNTIVIGSRIRNMNAETKGNEKARRFVGLIDEFSYWLVPLNDEEIYSRYLKFSQ